MPAGKHRALNKDTLMGKLLDEGERPKVRIRAKVEHPYRVIKRQFGHLGMRYRGSVENTQQLRTLFALSNLWVTRRRILQEARA
jgi:IS5 family transposase